MNSYVLYANKEVLTPVLVNSKDVEEVNKQSEPLYMSFTG